MIVEIKWLDIRHDDDLDEEEAKKLEPVEAVSYGILLVSSDEKVNISSTRFDDGEYRGVLSIPRCVVRKITELKEA